MFLKKSHKYIWCLCVFAAVCFLAGSFLRTRAFSLPGSYAVEKATMTAETTFLAEAVLSTTACAYEPTTQEMSGGGYASTEPAQDGSVTEVGVPDPADFYRAEKTETAARFFYALGAFSFAAFIFICPFSSPLLGPEPELILGGLSAMWFCWFKDMSGDFAFGAVLAVLATVLAVCLKGLVSWGCAKFSPRFSLMERIMTSRRKKGKLTAGTVIALASFGMTAAVFSLIFVIRTVADHKFERDALLLSLPLAAGCCLMLIFALKGARTYSRSVKNLSAQIKAVADNGAAVISDGYFSESERELAEIGKKRDEAVRKAIADERFKVELITNVSHDLRTPLTSILGYAELLKDETLSPEGKERLEKLNVKASYMREMVDDLFELTKVSSGETEAKKEELDLIKLTEQTLGMFEDSLEAKHLTVKRHYAEKEARLTTDGAMLHRVLDNLIANAVKYSPENTRIHIYLDRENDIFCIRVVNTANYEMDFDTREITKRFVRADKARSTSGSGLGLAIAKTYTEALGGSFDIRVEGDQFTAELNLK